MRCFAERLSLAEPHLEEVMNRPSFSIRKFATVCAAFAVVSGSAVADPDSRSERRQERQDVAESTRELQDDRMDLAQLSNLVEDWHRARARRDIAAERRIDVRIDRWLTRELAEARTEVREAKTEVVESRQEVRSEQGDAQRAARRGNAQRVQHERAELRDDRRDLADDQRDLQEQYRDLNKLQSVARELERLQPKFRSNRATPSQYAKKSALLRRLQEIARDEVQDTKTELREDRRELREDRR